MIRAINLAANNETVVQPQELPSLSLTNIWLELVDPTEEELKAVSAATKLSTNFLLLHKTDGIVDLRLEEGYTIINFLAMQDVVSTRRAYPIVLAFSKSFLVTVAKSEIQSIVNTAKERLSIEKNDPPSLVTYFIIDEIVANYYLQLQKLENLTAKIEEEVVEKTSSANIKHIFKLKSNMIRFNKVLWYERGIIFDLRKCGDNCMTTKSRIFFDSVHEELTRQIDIVETYREILSDAINVHLSAVSNRINLSISSLTVIIFYLTIVTTVTSFPNTVATFFGISQFGNSHIAIVTVALLLSILLPFIWLWRKRWLKYRPQK